MFISDMSLFKVNYVWYSTVYLWYIQRFLTLNQNGDTLKVPPFHYFV